MTLRGGGMGLPSYHQKQGGVIFAIGMDKHMHVMLSRATTDQHVRLDNAEGETIDNASLL